MDDLSFSQPARRNLTLPIAVAVAILALAGLAVLHYTPHSTADVAVTRTAIYPSHIVFKSSSIVLNSDQAQDDVYVLATVRITNHLRLPLFLKDFTATLTPGARTGTQTAAQTAAQPDTQTGGPPLTSSAIEKPDLANLLLTFPALGQLAAAQGSQPLYRDTKVDPAQTVEGYVILHFSGPESLWNNRQSASLSIDLYHQSPLITPIPR